MSFLTTPRVAVAFPLSPKITFLSGNKQRKCMNCFHNKHTMVYEGHRIFVTSISRIRYFGRNLLLPSILRVPGRFARESFRPGSFRPESFRPWVVSPLFGGSFRPCFLLKRQGLSQAMFGDIYGGLDFPTIIFR